MWIISCVPSTELSILYKPCCCVLQQPGKVGAGVLLVLVRKLRLRRGPAISMEEPQPRAGAARTVFLLHLGSSLHPNPGSWVAIARPHTCSHTSVVHGNGSAHTHPHDMPIGLSHSCTLSNWDIPARACHKGTPSTHPRRRSLMHNCSHLFSVFTDAHLDLRPSLDLGQGRIGPIS